MFYFLICRRASPELRPGQYVIGHHRSYVLVNMSNNITDHKSLSENNWISGKNLRVNFIIKSSFLDEINYWTWGGFWKQFRHRGYSNTDKIILTIHEGNTMKQDTLNCQLNFTSRCVPVGLFLPVLVFIVANTGRYRYGILTSVDQGSYPWPVEVLVYNSDVSRHLY